MAIYIIHKMRTQNMPNTVYVGRPSVLGNPYTIHDTRIEGHEKVDSIEEAVQEYEQYFDDIVDAGEDEEFLNELEKIYALALTGDVYLACWCKDEVKPFNTDYKLCHADVIRDFINYEIQGATE